MLVWLKQKMARIAKRFLPFFAIYVRRSTT